MVCEFSQNLHCSACLAKRGYAHKFILGVTPTVHSINHQGKIYLTVPAFPRLRTHRHCQRMSVALLRQLPPARRCFHGCPPTEMATSDHKCASLTEVSSLPHAPPVASSWSAFPEELLVPRLAFCTQQR